MNAERKLIRRLLDALDEAINELDMETSDQYGMRYVNKKFNEVRDDAEEYLTKNKK